MTWQEALRGVAPWPGARVIDVPSGRRGYLRKADVFEGQAWWFIEWDSGIAPGDPTPERVVLDLEHGPTCREFTALLALRLGAPPEAVEEGVQVLHDCEGVRGRRELAAGATWDGVHGQWRYRWTCALPEADSDNTARAFAWRSVTP